VPSPTGSTFGNKEDPFAKGGPNGNRGSTGNLLNGGSKLNPNAQSSSSLAPPGSQSNTKGHKKSAPSISNPQTAHDFLLLGIEHHEADRLVESARCFEKSTQVDGGCGVGCLMWGLALRHGWGCGKDEKKAFKFLQKAAESAVGDLERVRRGSLAVAGMGEKGAVQQELVLAIYEVGQCFFQGWGVPKDQKMAFVCAVT